MNTGWGAAAGDGAGQSITVRFARPVQLVEVGLVPGFAKFGPRRDTNCEPAEAFPRNRFISEVRYDFDDGTSAAQTFSPRGELQRTAVDTVTGSVTITIVATVQPQGADDDTIISEAMFLGSEVR